jgi:ATP-dependent Clp protease adaptor protein ClpS
MIFEAIFSMSDDSDTEGGVAVKNRVKRPKKYKVLLHNDDYTTMEFVIYVLQKVFGKTFDEAQEIMMQVHMKGSGVCGIYTFEIAETKVSKVEGLAKDNGHPLMCTMEQE